MKKTLNEKLDKSNLTDWGSDRSHFRFVQAHGNILRSPSFDQAIDWVVSCEAPQFAVAATNLSVLSSDETRNAW